MTKHSALRVRERETSDLHELGSTLVRVHKVDRYPVEGVADPEGWLKAPREIAAWTALLNGRPIGHVSLTRASAEDDAVQVWIDATNGSLDDIAVVVRLFVDPDHRGHGAGQELMRAAYEHASALGRQLVFDVMLKDQQAIRLYEALGCLRLGLITHHHGDGLAEPAAVYVAPMDLPGHR
jgi:ribosomal protein S18 acetylase RimI-like enzyme